MHDQVSHMDARVERILTQRIRPAERSIVADARVKWWPVTDPGGAVGRGEPVPWHVGVAAPYEDITLPHPWGPAWGTTWFRLDVEVPDGKPDLFEVHVDLGWADHSPGFQAEALVYDSDGRVIKGLHPKNHWLPVPDRPGTLTYYVEAASNPLLLDVPPFIPVADGDLATASTHPRYMFRSAQLVRINSETRQLAADLDVLLGLAATLPEDSPRRWRLSVAMQDALDALDTERVPQTARNAREKLSDAMSLPADHDAMQITAVGHAHIDTAWLWPTRETKRKVARTLANVVRLLEDGYRFHFALPAAQHVEWLAQTHPDLTQRVREWVEEGSIVPVGGMWVEPDAVLPGGEAMCRQLLHGQRAFEHHFGRRCSGIWLPDSFGYSGALPQIAALAGAKWFLTQKLSWNRHDTFPHNSFWWEGIDGTRLFTHFPAADTYNSDLSAADVDRAQRNFKEKGRANATLVPFGYGDGGGGPTRDMVWRAERMRNLCGAPRVLDASPDEFFTKAMAELTEPPVWVGELYLELHRGTFTTQCATKRGNRRNEALLRETETWWTMAALAGLGDYPYDELEQLWRMVLLGQFHDILPGTSIAWVHDEIAADHARVTDRLQQLADQARSLLTGQGTTEVYFNGAPVAIDGLPPLGAGVPDLPAETTLRQQAGGWRLDSDHLDASFDERGRLVGLIDRHTGRELIPPGVASGVLHLVPDFPTMWDAWDTEQFQRKQPRVIDDFDVVELPGNRLCCRATWGSSSCAIIWGLSRDGREVRVDVELDWHEHDLLAKLALPVDLHTSEAAFETQFGHIRRAIHENTSWDAERFEVNVHRWLHIDEAGYGVAIANDASYGCDMLRIPRQGGGSAVLVRPSLVRGPRFPDPETDQGRHQFAFSIRPGATKREAFASGYALNHHPVPAQGHPLAPLVTAEGLVIEALKLAEDRSGEVIVRLYEPLGARHRATVHCPSNLVATRVDILEDALLDAHLEAIGEGQWALDVHPFEIVTLRLGA